jgi:copper chaperone CopZ
MKPSRMFLFSILLLGVWSCNESTPLKNTEVVGAEEKTELRLSIDGMMCMQACGGKILKEISAEPGVLEVKIDFKEDRETNYALVRWDEKQTTPKSIAKVVDEIADGRLYKVTEMEVVTTKRAAGSSMKSSKSDSEGPSLSESLPINELFRFLEKLIVRP